LPTQYNLSFEDAGLRKESEYKRYRGGYIARRDLPGPTWARSVQGGKRPTAEWRKGASKRAYKGWPRKLDAEDELANARPLEAISAQRAVC
jgi:hypothetical protein